MMTMDQFKLKNTIEGLKPWEPGMLRIKDTELGVDYSLIKNCEVRVRINHSKSISTLIEEEIGLTWKQLMLVL